MTKWAALSARERILVLISGGFVAFAIVYWGVWQPWSQYSQQVSRQVVAERNLLNWVTTNADRIVTLRSDPNQQHQILGKQQGVNQIVSQTARSFNVDLVKMQPRSANQLQVWVQPLPFNTLLSWLGQLESRYGITASMVDLSADETSGQVTIGRLHFTRAES